ncbi:MAG TPA: glycosyltransferase [Acidimicrobiales bacterium]|nr:glycosyltransferase [Acidimicrobiales bacterium]
MSVPRPTAPDPVDASSGVLDLDLDRPLPAIAAPGCEREVRCLLRRGGVPVGCVDLTVPGTGLAPAAVAERVDPDRWAARSTDPVAGAVAGGGGGAADLTVAIATRDRPEALGRALDSVQASTAPPARIVVVDNAPGDDATAALVAARRAADPRITYVREGMAGLACAHNAALPLVDTPFVAFTDDDVVVDPGWTAWVRAGFDAADDVACVTGLIFPAELRTAEQWWIERGAAFAKGYDRRVVDPAVEARRDPLFPFAAGSFGSGANMAFATDVLRAMGGFDPALGAGSGSLGGDDLAAIHDVLARGHRLVYEPAAVVFHHHHEGYDALRRQVYGYGAGLTAYLTSLVVDRPATALAMAARAGRGARHALAPSSPRNTRRPGTHAELARVERAGMLSGPWRYVRTRHQRRGLRPAATPSGGPR